MRPFSRPHGVGRPPRSQLSAVLRPADLDLDRHVFFSFQLLGGRVNFSGALTKNARRAVRLYFQRNEAKGEN